MWLHILISINPKEIEEIIKSDANNKNLDESAIKIKVNEEIKAKEERKLKIYETFKVSFFIEKIKRKRVKKYV